MILMFHPCQKKKKKEKKSPSLGPDPSARPYTAGRSSPQDPTRPEILKQHALSSVLPITWRNPGKKGGVQIGLFRLATHTTSLQIPQCSGRQWWRQFDAWADWGKESHLVFCFFYTSIDSFSSVLFNKSMYIVSVHLISFIQCILHYFSWLWKQNKKNFLPQDVTLNLLVVPNSAPHLIPGVRSSCSPDLSAAAPPSV